MRDPQRLWLSRKLNQLMDARGLCGVHLADRAGVHRNTVGAILNCEESPSLEVLIKLARALEVGLDELLPADREQVREWLPSWSEHYRESDWVHSPKYRAYLRRQEEHQHELAHAD